MEKKKKGEVLDTIRNNMVIAYMPNALGPVTFIWHIVHICWTVITSFALLMEEIRKPSAG